MHTGPRLPKSANYRCTWRWFAILQSDWRSRFRDWGPRNMSTVTRPHFHVMSGWGLGTRLIPHYYRRAVKALHQTARHQEILVLPLTARESSRSSKWGVAPEQRLLRDRARRTQHLLCVQNSQRARDALVPTSSAGPGFQEAASSLRDY